jgi:hypothetical protein
MIQDIPFKPAYRRELVQLLPVEKPVTLFPSIEEASNNGTLWK